VNIKWIKIAGTGRGETGQGFLRLPGSQQALQRLLTGAKEARRAFSTLFSSSFFFSFTATTVCDWETDATLPSSFFLSLSLLFFLRLLAHQAILALSRSNIRSVIQLRAAVNLSEWSRAESIVQATCNMRSIVLVVQLCNIQSYITVTGHTLRARNSLA
jgi:hypothetical protein